MVILPNFMEKADKKNQTKAPAPLSQDIAKEIIEQAKAHSMENPAIKIKVFGVGGGGCSIVGEIANIVAPNKKISFLAANTDIQSLESLPENVRKLVLGKGLTNGLGCGMNPDLARQAAEQSKEEIKREVANCDLCIFISGLGGGTGSGAMPIFAEASRLAHKISLGIFTLPFEFEGEKRRRIAQESLENIRPHLSASLVIPNEKIFKVIDPRTAIKQSFSAINKSLAMTIKGLLETLYEAGLINIDFADFRSILEGYGKTAYQNSIEGERKDLNTMIEKLLDNPLVDNGIVSGREAKAIEVERIMFNITGPADLKMMEVEEIAQRITSPNIKAKIIFGILLRSDKSDKIRVTLLAIGEGSPVKNIRDAIFRESKPELKPEIKSPVPKVKHKKPVKKAVSKPVQKITITTHPTPGKGSDNLRKNAIEIKREAEDSEKKMSEQEKKWDIPAFLRIKK